MGPSFWFLSIRLQVGASGGHIPMLFFSFVRSGGGLRGLRGLRRRVDHVATGGRACVL